LARISKRDFIQLNTGIFPATSGVLFPALLLLTSPFQDLFTWSAAFTNLVALLIVALLTFLVLRADSVRFAIAAVVKRFSLRAMLQYVPSSLVWCCLFGILIEMITI
jgi:hypothetical protein